MSDPSFETALSLLGDPALVCSLDGRIVARNRAASRLLGDGADSLVELAADPPQLREQLRRWSGSSQPRPAALSLATAEGHADFQGVGRRATTDQPWVMLRLVNRPFASKHFKILNHKVDELRREVERRVRAERRSNAQTELLEAIARGPSLEASLDAVARFAEGQSPGTQTSILLVEEGVLRHGAAPTLPRAYVEAIDGIAIGPRAGSCGTAAYRGRPVVVEDIATDPLWADFRDLALAHGLRACWSTPVMTRDGAVVATVAHYRAQPSTLSPVDEQITNLARHMTGIAIDRFRAEQVAVERADELARVNERKNEFLAMLGHELRNPMSSLTVTAELLSGPDTTREQRAQWLTILKRQLALVRRLVDDLLDVSRVTLGKIELRRTRIDLGDLVELVAAAHAAQDERVHVRRSEQRYWVEADRERLQQVVENLIANAQKFTPSDGRIDAIVEADRDEVCLRVVDTGAGIGTSELPHLFDLFTQGPRNLAREQGGLGIGLTLVKALVSQHGGTVSARSDGLGRGSEFCVRLPRAPGPQSRASPPASPTHCRGSADVVVVDDDEDAADLLALLLSQWGHRARVANDGQQALELLAQRIPDWVVLDIGLPVMDGFELARRIRSMPRAKHCRLVALTGYGQASDESRAIQAGCDVFLVKPVEPDRLRALLSSSSPDGDGEDDA